MKKTIILILLLIPLLTSCSKPNPKFKELKISLDNFNCSSNIDYFVYSFDSEVVISSLMVANRGNFLVKEKVYFSHYEDSLFTYEITFKDEVILSRKINYDANIILTEFPKTVSIGPKGTIHAEDLKFKPSSPGFYEYTVYFLAFYNNEEFKFSASVKIYFDDTYEGDSYIVLKES